VEPHLLRIERAQISIYLFRPCVQNPYERLARQVQLVKPTEKGFRGDPRPRFSNYIADLAWSRLGVEPAELSEIAVGREIFQTLLGLLPRDPP